MITTILTREEAAAARKAAADQLVGDRIKREGPSERSAAWTHARSLLPRDTTNERMPDFPATVRTTMDRRNGKDMAKLTGLASVVNKPYEMWDFFGPYEEIVYSGAFDKTLASGPDVPFVVNHTGVTMARTIPKSSDMSPTLELSMGSLDGLDGLLTDAWLNPNRVDVKILVSAVDDGLITEMSFKFQIIQGRWSEDFMSFTLVEVDIDRGDVSAVNYGANPYTVIGAGRAAGWVKMTEAMPRGAKIAMAERLAQDVDVMDWREHRKMIQLVRATDVTTSVVARGLDSYTYMLP